MARTKNVRSVLRSEPVLEGAGVRLRRAFGYGQVPQFDPFLLLDDFHSSNPDEYQRGFPWHPHRGIETITYVLFGEVEHGDSLGNTGVISSGDIQWMTAGSGIIHQEMPKGRDDGLLWGFQLWANLPASHKMMRPRYREIKSSEIPVARPTEGVTAKIICGELGGVRGPVEDIVTDPAYYDVSIAAGSTFAHLTPSGHTAIAYVIDGTARFGPQTDDVEREHLVAFEDGEEIRVSAHEGSVRLLFMSGSPIGESVAWQGPVVMNTQEELGVAFDEYRRGTFLKD